MWPFCKCFILAVQCLYSIFLLYKKGLKMGNKTIGTLLGLAVTLVLAGCVTAAATRKPTVPINKVALVSLSVSNWRGMVSGTAGDAKAEELINSTLFGLVVFTENKLSGFMHVTRLSSFIGNAGYRSLGVKNELGLMLPKVNGMHVELFSTSNDDVIAADLKPEVARKLCADLHVDAVVVVYSEWAAAQGHFVPTRKALAKNVVSVWDRNGELVFNKRVDEMGDAVIGGPYVTVVNVGTIKQWSIAYNKSFEQIAKEMKAALKS